ncbi:MULTISPECIES: hypothetical protein [unclassified Pseudomonas]|jgi:hypothetical protein|uniref:hypothetical protein n=1 Tax=unclassified Pseudomonas TaxID=196821 RepID=UPI000CF46554|nr:MULTISPECIES: hypothetical protein [unclassified Pseudomonas]UVL66219.1 hypothetical protein LOY53_22885 [Pseudomonas sp. B21-031]
MRMTKNKRQVLEALACIYTAENVYPPHHATRVQELLRDNLGYGDFDLANLTRTLKALVDQGLVKFSTRSADVSGDTFGCISRRYEREMVQYWPADLDLEAMRVQYKITSEDRDLRFHNFFQRMDGLPELSMDEFRAFNARKTAA